jgi:predicted ester cyclase
MGDAVGRAGAEAGPAEIAVLERARQRWNAGDLAGYLELYAPGAVLHGYPGVEPGLASIRAFYEGFWAAFPGSQLVFEDVRAAGDAVTVRFAVDAVHGGPFQGLPPTGRRVALSGITILRFAGGRCVERWSQADFLGLRQQLGAVPAPGSPG